MRYALKFAYDGPRFGGYARQPGKCTVEGEILRALKAKGIARDLRSASRTDKGVSAAGNVIAIETDFPAKGIVPALNSELEGIHFWGIARVAEDFNPRHAEQRWYRYFLHAEGVPSIGKLRKAAKQFIGEHDFRLFSKKDTGKENTVLTIDSITFTKQGEFLVCDIKAQRFLWELVRRLLSALISVAEGKIPTEAAEKMLAGENALRGGIKPLDPKFLVLVDVEYDFEFKEAGAGRDYFRERASECKALSEVMGFVSESLRRPG